MFFPFGLSKLKTWGAGTTDGDLSIFSMNHPIIVGSNFDKYSCVRVRADLLRLPQL